MGEVEVGVELGNYYHSTKLINGKICHTSFKSHRKSGGLYRSSHYYEDMPQGLKYCQAKLHLIE